MRADVDSEQDLYRALEDSGLTGNSVDRGCNLPKGGGDQGGAPSLIATAAPGRGKVGMIEDVERFESQIQT